MSTKNLLQEKYPRNTIQYQTERIGGQDHQPLYRSTVYISNINLKAIGEICGSRIASEKSAAAIALEISGGSIKNQPLGGGKRKINEKIPTLILIDLENIPQNSREIEPGENVSIVGFLRFDHPMALKKDIYSFPIELAHSPHKDASDTLIIMFATQYLLQMDIEKLVIVSRDHFAHTLKDLLRVRYAGLIVDVVVEI